MSRASRSRRASPDVVVALARRSASGQGRNDRVTGLGALLLLTLALRLALAFTLAGHPLLQPVGDLDTGAYWRFAERVASGDILMQHQALDVSPLYIYWLALAQVLTGASVAGVLALQALLGTVAVGLVAATTMQWAAPGRSLRAGLVAGGVLTLTSVVALQEAVILQSALDPLLMALLAWTTTRALQEPSAGRWAWSGVALALLATNRPNAWLLGIVVGLAAAFRAGLGEPALPSRMPGQEGRAGCPDPALPAGSGGRVSALIRVAALAAGVAVVLAPLMVRTRLAEGYGRFLPTHGGLNFYIGNHAQANGTYTVIDGIRPSIEGQRLDMYNVATKALGRPPGGEVSWYFVGLALDWWRDAPLQATRLLAWKLWLATHSWELPVNVSHAWFREHTPLLWVMPFGAWLLAPLGLAVSIGGGVLVGDERRASWRWFRWLLPVYLLSVALFFVVDRYRMPALVLGAINVGLLASMTREHRARAGRGAIVGMAVAAVVFVAGLVPLPFQRGEADADTQMAVIAIDAGRDAEGEQWLASAVARHPAPGIAWFRAGLAWQARNDLPRAEKALREAHRLDPDVSDVSFALAGVLLAQGKGADALPLLKQLESGDAGAPTARTERYRLDIALAHWQNGDEGLARNVLAGGVTPEGLPLLRARALAAVDARHVALADWLLSVYRRHAPGDAEVVEKLGLMRARTGDAAGAASLFEEAARLDPARATARFNLAVLRAQQGRRDEAIVLLQEALRIDPTYAQAAGALRELRGDQP